MKIDSFRTGSRPERRVCDRCDCITCDIGTIALKTTDPKRCYKSSNKAIMFNYRMRVCEKCFKEITKRFDLFIYGKPKKN